MTTLLCVPIMARSVESAHADAVQAREHGADIVEYRIDELFSGPEDEGEVLRLVGDSPVACIVTCRPTWEGGHYDGDDDDRVSLFERLGTGERPPRYIDVELAAYARSANLRQKINLAVNHAEQRRDVSTGLILSTHDFSGRPADLTRRLIAMGDQAAASVSKVAFRARSLRDNLEIFDILAERERPTIALGMGEFGLMSRVLAPKFGAFLTFASLRDESATAPGQPTLDELLNRYRFRSIGRETRVYGIVGWPVGHSMSPLIHNAGFEKVGHDGVYLPLPIASSESGKGGYESFKATLLELLHHPGLGLSGCSVTMPHKEHLVKLATEEGWELDSVSRLAGAANTLTVASGMPAVCNTDAVAAIGCLREAMGDLAGGRVTVLGAGGVARGIAFALAAEGVSVTICNRSADRAETLAGEIALSFPGLATSSPWAGRQDTSPDAFINCTSVGMSGGPAPDETPLDRAVFERRKAVLMETVYSPVRTKLLSDARDAGWRTIDGVEMFVGQGARQFRLWTGRPAPAALFNRLVRDALGG